jgi:hypothetical protein
VPASGTLETEWGPAPATLPWGTQVSLNSTQIRNLNVSLNWNGRGPGVFTETTGRDDNHDGLLNDRRPGVGLNSLRTTSFSTLNLRVAYKLGRRTRSHAGRRAGGRRRAAVPGQYLRQREQRHESRQLHRLQRRADVLELHEAHGRAEPTQHEHGHERELLIERNGTPKATTALDATKPA